MKMFKVVSISGEYATLMSDEGEELFIALVLLPCDIDLGTKLKYENFEFSVI